ncbi:MAG TPA: hypothetical protein VEI73_16310 [Candidatus Acidoferrum sp.]|nr:hypothetical protein [Candidatus Acidoferrum sp.]
MKRIVIALALLLAVSLRAQAQAPQPVPLAQGGQPGEPHHHLKIENEYVRAYYVEVPPHESTQLHQHDHDYLFVTLGDSDVINAVRDKPEVHLVLKDGEVHFMRGGFAHVARNLADTPFRNVTIELLHSIGQLTNLCAQVAAVASSGGCDKALATSSGGHGFTVEGQMETPETRLDLVRLDPETKGAAAAVPENSLLICLSDSQVQIDVKGAPVRTLHGGEVLWIAKGSRGAASNPSEKPASYLQLSLTGQ